jgi:hypothetical protein
MECLNEELASLTEMAVRKNSVFKEVVSLIGNRKGYNCNNFSECSAEK